MPRRVERILTSRYVFAQLIGATVTLVILFGIVISVVDRNEFPTVWLGMWWAVGTVTTVGYGDVVPTDPEGRIIAAVLMIVGIAFLSLITATVASTLVLRAQGAAGEADSTAAGLERLERRLEDLERLLRQDRTR